MSDTVAILTTILDADSSKLDAMLARVDTQLKRAGQDGGAQFADGLKDGAAAAEQAAAKIVTAQARAERAIEQLAQAQSRTAAAAAQAQAAQSRAAQAAAQAAGATDKAALSVVRLAAEQAKAAAAAQRLATEEQRTAAAAARAATAQAQQARAAQQLAAAQSRAAATASPGRASYSGLQSSLASLSATAAGFGQALGALGIATGIAAIGQFALEAGKAAVQLERTQATVRAVAGSQERYAEILRIAAANQKLFGGSTQENIAGMQQFLFISNRTGASLEELNRVAQLLSVINPTEGFEGAGVALSELFAGDITSIVERFNLPRQAIRELTAEGVSAQEKLAGLTTLLAQQGVTAETLSASLTTNAQTYANLGAQASTAFTNIGAAAAAAAAPVANFIAAGLAGFNTLVTKGQEAAALAPQIFASSAASYDAYIAKIGEVNAQLGTIGERVFPLTQAQFQFAQSLVQTGATAEQAFATVAAATPALDLYGQALGQASKEGPEAAAAIAGFEAVIVNAATATEEGALQTQQLIQAYLDGTVSADQLAVGLSNVELTATLAAQAKADAAAAADDLSAADQGAAASMDLAAAAAQAEEAALRAATDAAFEQANAGATVEDQALAAARALAESGAAGEAAANRLASSTSRLDQLTAAYYRLEAAARAAAGATGAASALTGIGTKPGTSARDIARALPSLRFSPAAGGGGGSGGRGGRGGSGGGGKSEAEKQAEKDAKAAEQAEKKRVAAAERTAERLIDIEKDKQESLTALVEEYAEKRADAEESFADAQISSRADFYESLADVEDQGLRKQLSAAYEAAQLEAAELAKTKGADVAEEFLAEQERILAARAQRAEKLRDLEEKAAKGDTGAASELEYRRGVEQLRQQEEQRRLDKIRSGEDSLANQEAEERADIEGDAAKRQQELLGGAQELGQAEIDRLTTLALQTAEYEKQAALAGKLGGSPAAAAPASTGAGAGAAGLPAATTSGAVAVVSPELQAAIEAAVTQAADRIVAAVGSGAATQSQAASRGLTEVARKIDTLKQGGPSTGV